MADPPTVNRSPNTDADSEADTEYGPPRLEGTFPDLNRSETPHTRLALFYETHEELFKAATSFVKEGLARGERCWYIADETTEAEVVEAFRDAGVDVESARQTGDFDIHSTDTEFEGENGEFDPTAMIDAWTDRARETTEQGEYEGLRIVCEATWQLDSDTDERIAGAKDHEHRLNELFSREECLGLCAYNRERFPPEALEAALEHHPQVLSDGMLAENCYYVPPEESFDSAESTIERQLQTLSERARTTRERRESEERLQKAISIDTVGVLFFALDGGISHANETFKRMSGYSRDELHDTDWEDLTPPEFMDATERKAEELATHGNPEPYEKQFIREDGSRWWALCAPKRLSGSGEDTECIEFIIDITERKEATARLADELTDTQELQELSTSLIHEGDIDALYDEVLDAAVTIMDADFASIQLLDRDQDELGLLAHRGFSPEAAAFWEWVDIESNTTCGKVLNTGERAVVTDVEASEFMAGTDDLETFRQTGIRAVQTTPLISRDGEILGMISTHWTEPHEPATRTLDLLGVLARQAADLIERTRTEEELHKSERQRQLALDAAEMATWSADPRTSDLTADEQFYRIWHDSADRFSYEQAFDHIHPDDRQRIRDAVEAAARPDDPVPYEEEFRVVHPDGSMRWLFAKGQTSFVRTDDGRQLESFDGTLQDITERKQREEDLRESEERLRAATDAAEVGVWELDLQTNEALYTSPRYAEILGYDEVPEDWSLEHALDHYPPEDHERLMTWLEEGIGESMFESRITRTDGEQRWISVGGEVYEDGDGAPLRAVGTMQDITDRKRRGERDQFLLELSDALRPASDPFEIQREASRILREQLGAMRVAYLEMNDDGTTCTCLAEDIDEDISFSFFDTVWDWRDFDPTGLDELSRGHTISREDVRAADDLTPEQKATFAEFDFRAFIITSLMKSGRLVGFFLAHFEQPHERDHNETLMMEETAERTWSAVERARAEEASRESEVRQRLALEAGEMGAWELDLQTNDSPERTPRHDEIFGYNEPLEDWGFETLLEHTHPDDRERVEERFEEAFETGVWEFETRIIRADDEQRWIAARGKFYENGGKPVRAVGTVQDITERKEREQRLARQREQIETLQNRLLETSPTGILVMDASGEITLANDRAAEIVGTTPDEMVGLSHDAPALGIVGPDGESLPNERLPFLRARRSGQAVFDTEVGIMDSDGERVWLSLNVAPVYKDGDEEPTEMVVTIEDITERKQYENALTQLNDATRELIDTDATAITDRTAEIARDVLGVELAALWRYDSDSGELELHKASTDQETALADIAYPDGFDERAWNTFVADELEVDNDLPPASGIAPSDKPVRSGVLVSLGRHGVLCLGSLSTETFDEATVDLAETVTATLKTALDRADREKRLEEQNNQLTRLERINSVIREIAQMVVEAESRDEIERAVCERLTSAEQYELAWIGERETGSNTIHPRVFAGTGTGYIDAITVTADDTETGQGAVGTAMRTKQTHVVGDILADPVFAPWRESALDHGFRSCIGVPLLYEESTYGVLSVYADEPRAFDGMEQEVLTELGETIAHAIAAVETRQSLHTDRIVELDLQFRNVDTVLVRLARDADCQLEFNGLVPGDHASRLFFTAHGTSSDRVLAAGEASMAVDSIVCLTERDDKCVFELVTRDPTLASILIKHEAMVQTFSTDSEVTTGTVTLPSTANVRAFIDTVQDQYPNTELVARQDHDRPLQSRHELHARFEEQLTDRQQEILRTAYQSGFFESPRVRTGKELSDALGISQPTFIQHLRTAQRKLLAEVFDNQTVVNVT